MTIAEKLLRAKTDIDEAYEAGYKKGSDIRVLFGTYEFYETPNNYIGLSSNNIIDCEQESVYAYFTQDGIDYYREEVSYIEVGQDLIIADVLGNITLYHTSYDTWMWQNGDVVGDFDSAYLTIEFVKPITTSRKKYEEFMSAVKSSVNGDYDKGYADGKQDGIAEGIEQGKSAERNAFWDTNLQNGNRTHFERAYMGGGWNKNNFFPNHDIRPSSAYYAAANMFMQFGQGASESLDLVELAEQQDIEFDFSQVKEFAYTFASCGISRLGTIDMRNANYIYATFYQYEPYALRTIEKIISAETTPWQASCFREAYNLKEVRFEGVVAGSLEFNASGGLSKASMQNIVSVFSDTASGLSVTFNKGAVRRAFETSEGALDGDTSPEWLNLIATKPNWTFNLS